MKGMKIGCTYIEITHLPTASHNGRLGAWRNDPAGSAHWQVLALLELNGLGKDQMLLGRAVPKLGSR